MDLTNVAYSDEYQNMCNEAIAVRILKTDEPDIILSEGGYSRIITSYTDNYEGYNSPITYNKVYNPDNILIHEYKCLQRHPSFCTPVTHSNNREYLVYNEGGYGYSVLDIESKETFKYIPAASFILEFSLHIPFTFLKFEETFIAYIISYNPANDIFAATGYFWAGRCTTFLFEVKNPMKQFTRYLDIGLIVPHRDKYYAVDFHEWEDTDILLKCSFEFENGSDCEIIKIPQTKYMRFMKESL